MLILSTLNKTIHVARVALFPIELNQNKKVQYTLSMNQSQSWQLAIYSRIYGQSCIFQTHTGEIAQIGSDQICKMKNERNWQLSSSKRCMTLIQRTEFETWNLNLNQCQTKQYWMVYFWSSHTLQFKGHNLCWVSSNISCLRNNAVPNTAQANDRWILFSWWIFQKRYEYLFAFHIMLIPKDCLKFT